MPGLVSRGFVIAKCSYNCCNLLDIIKIIVTTDTVIVRMATFQFFWRYWKGGGVENGKVKYKKYFQVFVSISETNYTFYFLIYQGVTKQ
jgi:hypothetical protein